MDRIDHIAVAVTDISAALNWYRANFELNTIYSDESWALIEFENVRLALVLPEQHPPHFAVEKDNLKEFEPLNSHRDGTKSVYIDDPWGNVIELIETKSSAVKNKTSMNA